MPPRLARPDEARALRDLVRGSYAAWVDVIGREPAPMHDDFAARIAAGQAWVVEQGGTLLGVLVIEDTTTGLLIENVAVASAAQGTGLGRALMAFAEAEAARRGHRRVWLYTHEKMERNIALYARLGYVETHRAEQSGFARVFMAKALAPAPRPQRRPVQDRPRPPLLHRWALSLIGPDRCPPKRGLVIFFGISGVVALGAAWLMGHHAWRDWTMSTRWMPAQATVIDVGRARRVKGSWHFTLLLRATAPDGRTFQAWAMLEHIVPRRLEDPDPRILPGDRLAVVMDPARPSRMTTLGSLQYGSGLFSTLLCGSIGIMSLIMTAAGIKARAILPSRRR